MSLSRPTDETAASSPPAARGDLFSSAVREPAPPQPPGDAASPPPPAAAPAPAAAQTTHAAAAPDAISARDLRVTVRGRQILRGLDLTLRPGRFLALLGVNGSGKTVFTNTLLGLYAEDPGARVDGELSVGGQRLSGLDAEGLRRLRARKLSVIFQDYIGSLNPLLSIAGQMRELRRLGAEVGGPAQISDDEIARALAAARLPRGHAHDRPHELSAGMMQRALVAMATVNSPALLISDEITSSLDVLNQEMILALLRGQQAAHPEMAILFVTHNLRLVHRYADEVAVMYGGRVVETGPTALVFGKPAHPATRRLLRPGGPSRDDEPELALSPHPPPGCVFYDVCDPRLREKACTEGHPPFFETRRAESGVHLTACRRYEALDRALRELPKREDDPAAPKADPREAPPFAPDPLAEPERTVRARRPPAADSTPLAPPPPPDSSPHAHPPPAPRPDWDDDDNDATVQHLFDRNDTAPHDFAASVRFLADPAVDEEPAGEPSSPYWEPSGARLVPVLDSLLMPFGGAPPARPAEGATPLLELVDVTKTFRRPLQPPRRVLKGISLRLHRGEHLGLIGASGSGKTTLGNVITGIYPLGRGDAGRAAFDGVDLRTLSARRSPIRHRIQMIFQDTGVDTGSLDPRHTAEEGILESFHARLRAAGERASLTDLAENRRWIRERLKRFGLAGREGAYPDELSGGQRQRVEILRALNAVDRSRPSLVVADEPTSFLDPFYQERTLRCLREFEDEFEVTYVIISHSLSLVRNYCRRVVVLLDGEIIEEAPMEAVFRASAEVAHPYTELLLLASTGGVRGSAWERTLEDFEIDTRTPGCPLAACCPYRIDRCATVRPALNAVGEQRAVACHVRAPQAAAGRAPLPAGAAAPQTREARP